MHFSFLLHKAMGFCTHLVTHKPVLSAPASGVWPIYLLQIQCEV